jgi:hypothetical protein
MLLLLLYLLQGCLVLGLSFLASLFFIAGIKILTANKQDYKHSWYRTFLAPTNTE